jgi:hypothetical protein
MDREEVAVILDTLIKQAERALQVLEEETDDRIQARVRVMTTTITDLQNEAGL